MGWGYYWINTDACLFVVIVVLYVSYTLAKYQYTHPFSGNQSLIV